MRRAFRGGLALFAAMLAAACATLPPPGERIESHAIPPDSGTRLGTAVAPLAAAHPGKSGIHALTVASDAFAARVLLAAAADRSLDVQYYIWHADETGVLLLQALHNAAARGVRVRLLVDDQNTRDTEPLLAALAARPNVEVRLYNPFANRSLRALGYLGDFERLNRRMHNKSFTADNQVAIVGGRNIGNEYFGAGTEVPFKDLDVIAIGAAVPEVSAEFDLYWNSASAYPIASVVPPAGEADAAAFGERVTAVRESAEAQRYLTVVRDTPLVRQLLDRTIELEWATAHVVRDDPAKTLDPEVDRGMLMLTQLIEGESGPQRLFDVISPYFVPGARGTEMLGRLARNGVRVRVLTNSLAATDVAVVHSGYAKRRCDLARAGVRLYELKPVVEDVQARKKDRP
ncbi:MAG TPA: phospholipase D family protein, partial [Usitatibacter sp.]|nr:phospholipase D family protein [Usitatibacter sp.]